VSEPTFDPVPALVALADGGVDFVVIGGIAGRSTARRIPPTISTSHTRATRTRLGPVDILASPEGSTTYDRLTADAKLIEVDGREVRVASLDHLIAMKAATGQRKDELMVTEYRALADEIRARE